MNKFLPESIKGSLAGFFTKEGDDFEVTHFSYALGGCINSAGIMDTTRGRMFIKWNDKERFPGMFEAEAHGLKLLGNPQVIKVPETMFTAEAGSFAFIVMEYIQAGSRSKNYWELLGQNFSALHKISSNQFGLDHDNYIGSLPQVNNPESDWITFYARNRLDYQLKLAVDTGKMGKGEIAKYQELYQILPSLLPAEAPSLIHGDLWRGNLMTGPDGDPVIFDPAVYFGHREMDLAMTRLFGGFDSNFYDAYNEAFPLTPGFEKRLDIYQLYPLMVHVNLFGGGYIYQVNSVLNRFV